MKLSLKNVLIAGALAMTFSQAVMAETVRKSERVLVVLSELDSRGMPELAPLYRVLEDLTGHSVRAILQDKYENIYMLQSDQATLGNFKRLIYQLANKSEVRAIDVIVSVHGSPSRLVFSEGAYTKESIVDFMLQTSNRQEQINKIFVKKKLRALYNLACFGGRNIGVLKELGFEVVNGSRGVNANSEVELVPALTAWANGVGFKNSFSASNNPIALAISDTPIREAGRLANNALKDTDSEKLFSGDTDITISTAVR